MMRWLITVCLIVLTGTAWAQEDEAIEDPGLDSLTLQLKWLPQAQFAGYYAAQANGFYEEEGLDVTILPGGPGVEPINGLRNGAADVMVDWMPPALVAAERGFSVINIAQFFQFSGQTVACRQVAGITTPQDLRGKTVAVTKSGNEYAVLAWFESLGIPIDGSADGLTVVDRSSGASDLVDGVADCIAAQSYNELLQLKELGFDEDNLTIFDFEELGVATMQDGLYVKQGDLADPAMVSKLVRFIRASLKGWRFAMSKRDSTVDIVMSVIEEPGASRDHQWAMLTEMIRLIGPTGDFLGLLAPEDYNRTVDTLATGGIIAGPQQEAWTHSLWLQAQ